ncbi:MAG: hypothetical protein ABIO37_16200 [Caulobacteraceae bacterium]
MKPLDFVKAVGVAVLVFAVDMAAAFLAVFAYAQLIEPGRSREFYNGAALNIAPWSSHVVGPLIFLAAAYFFARRRPERDPRVFTAAFCVAYAILSMSVALSLETLEAAWREGTFLSMGVKFVGAAIGAALATRRIARAGSVA